MSIGSYLFIHLLLYLSINLSIYPLNQTLALARSSQDPVSQKILHEQDAEKVFLDLLTSQVELLLYFLHIPYTYIG